MEEKEYHEALEKARIFFLEKCGEMSLAHYRALTFAFKTAYELGLEHCKVHTPTNEECNG